MTRKKIAAAMGVVGVALLVLILMSGGFSGILTPRADSEEETADGVIPLSVAERLEEAAAHDGVYRPYVAVDFDYVTFSGLYLTGEREEIAAWVMWGFCPDGVFCFYQKSDGRDIDGDGVFNEDDAPADGYGVEYVLRAPEPAYASHDEWAVSESRAAAEDYYGLSAEESGKLFGDGVLYAARNDRLVARAAFVAAWVLVAAVVLIVAVGWRKGEDEGEDASESGSEDGVTLEELIMMDEVLEEEDEEGEMFHVEHSDEDEEDEDEDDDDDDEDEDEDDDEDLDELEDEEEE